MPTKPTAKSKTKPKAAAAAPPSPPPPVTVAEPVGKLGALTTLLRRPEGASLAALADATGWKQQSVRGALAGALKARGHVVTSAVLDGVRVYRLPPVTDGQVAP